MPPLATAPRRLQGEHGDPILVFEGDYVTAHALLLDRHPELHGPDGGIVFGVPGRNALVCVPDPARVADALAATLALHDEAERPISQVAYLRGANGELAIAQLAS